MDSTYKCKFTYFFFNVMILYCKFYFYIEFLLSCVSFGSTKAPSCITTFIYKINIKSHKEKAKKN